MDETTRRRGAQPGNKNAAKARYFYRELMRQCEADPQIVVDIAQRLLIAARKGEPWAIREFRDTMDGKPAQAVEITGDPDNPTTLGFVVIPPKANGG